MYKLPLRTRHRIRSKVGILVRSIVPETNSRSNPESPSPGRLPNSAACSSNGAVPSPSSKEVRISVWRCSAFSQLLFMTALRQRTSLKKPAVSLKTHRFSSSSPFLLPSSSQLRFISTNLRSCSLSLSSSSSYAFWARGPTVVNGWTALRGEIPRGGCKA